MSTMKEATLMRRMRDRGFSVLETLVGIGMGGMLMIGGVTMYATANQTSAKAAVLQSQNQSLSSALDLISQNVVASNPILSAGTDELVIQSSDPQQATVDTRWVHIGSTLYEQVWSGAAKGYPFGTSTIWLDPTKTTSGVAPDGDGTQTTKVIATGVVPNAASAPVFAYFDKTGAGIDVSAGPITAQNGATTAVRRVDIALTAQAGSGTVQNKTSASPRNTDGGAGNPGAVAIPVCPAVTLSTASSGNPLVQFATVVGAPNYLIYRNSGLATTVTPPSGTTQGSWEDTGANAAPGQAISYTVLAQTASGVTSPSTCRPGTWRAAIPAPVFNPAQVLPVAAQATDWTSSTANPSKLQKPRISLAWGSVPGASEYVLYFRQIDPATGQPIDAGYRTAATMNASTLSFTWDDGGWGTEYAWKLVALAQSGSSAEADTTTLTHPPAPQGVTITPSYGTGSDTTVNGYNTITWSAVPAVTRYEVWRYNSGTSGAVTKIGTVASNASPLQYKDTVPYGTTYSYYVAAVNNGPRGGTTADDSSPNPEANAQAATGTIPASASTAAWFGPRALSDGGGIHSASVMAAHLPLATTTTTTTNPGSSTPAPAVASQLQYPPIPSVNSVTTATSSSTRDFDGYNQVTWQPALSAVGYYAQKTTVVTGSNSCISASCTMGNTGITGTSLTDPAPKGSQYLYSVQAYNATGVSVQFSAKVALTQRPAPPALTMTAAPTLSTDNASFSIVQNGDTGNDSSNYFCTSTTCNYKLVRAGSVMSTSPSTQSGASLAWNNVGNPDGASEAYSAQSQNTAVTNGGWSDPSTTVTVNTYPGDFGVNVWLGDASGNNQARVDMNTYNMSVSGSKLLYSPGWTTGSWTASAGASSIYTHRINGGGEVTNTDSSYALPGLPDNSHTYSGGGGGTTSDWGSPGTIYRIDITATAPNGLTRLHTTANVMTPAENPRASLLQVVCSGNTATSVTSPTPSQLLAARMIEFDPTVAFGNYNNAVINGYTYYSGQGPTQTLTMATPWGATGTGGSWNTITSGNGYGFYYGIRNEFDVYTKGLMSWNGPPSATVEFDMETYATFTSGCAPQGWTGSGLTEPTDPCYGYVPGTVCNAPNDQNRPQWRNWGE